MNVGGRGCLGKCKTALFSLALYPPATVGLPTSGAGDFFGSAIDTGVDRVFTTGPGIGLVGPGRGHGVGVTGIRIAP